MNYFKNKNILITGASNGLGSLLSKELSEEGSNLILVSRSLDKLKSTLKGCTNKKIHKIIKADFQYRESILNMTKSIISEYDKLDIIIHVAGGGLGIKNYFPTQEEYLKVFNLNRS